MKIKLVILFGSAAFLLKLAAYIFYDLEIAPEKQDYIFNMMALSELTFVLASFILTYLVFPYTKLVAIARSVFRLWLWATAYATIKELSGINTSDTPLETLIFCLMILSVGYYSILRIRKWESKAETS